MTQEKNEPLTDNQDIMKLLFKTYYEQCPHEKIRWAIDNYIMLEGIEIQYIKYQEVWRVVFVCNRNSEKYGDDVYWFLNYNECLEVWNMKEEPLNKYIESITL